MDTNIHAHALHWLRSRAPQKTRAFSKLLSRVRTRSPLFARALLSSTRPYIDSSAHFATHQLGLHLLIYVYLRTLMTWLLTWYFDFTATFLTTVAVNLGVLFSRYMATSPEAIPLSIQTYDYP